MDTTVIITTIVTAGTALFVGGITGGVALLTARQQIRHQEREADRARREQRALAHVEARRDVYVRFVNAAEHAGTALEALWKLPAESPMNDPPNPAYAHFEHCLLQLRSVYSEVLLVSPPELGNAAKDLVEACINEQEAVMNICRANVTSRLPTYRHSPNPSAELNARFSATRAFTSQARNLLDPDAQ